MAFQASFNIWIWNIPIHERMLWCSEPIQVMPNQTNGLEKMQILSINEIVSKEENLLFFYWFSYTFLCNMVQQQAKEPQ